MPRQETILTVFVASPSDVEEERNRLEDVVSELNISWARTTGVRLDLVRWETHAYPGVGQDAQDVINTQIPDDYDLFIGLMWYRFGTPTGRAGSGTAEEFQRAKARFDQDKSAVKLMIYFKDAPPPLAPSKLDTEQLRQVTEFRSRLGTEGGLYWSFRSADEFQSLVRLHLTRQVQAWCSTHLHNVKSQDTGDTKARPDPTAALNSGTDSEEDVGLLDLMEQLEDDVEEFANVMNRIGSATLELGERTTTRSNEIDHFMSGPDAKNRSTARRLISKSASDMDHFVHQMYAELPMLKKYLSSIMNALIRIAEMSSDFEAGGENIAQLVQNQRSINELRDSLATARNSAAAFQEKVSSLPRISSELNRAKKSVKEVLQKIIDELDRSQTMASEADASFRKLLGGE